ncbi:protein-disulfide isomerase [uncultured Psychromonas sp.]|uniref:protein-disulfide isomerase n=1 Tax=uncultured Psychromonas sp. TaxID=173974 RepID=UPI002614C1D2|nr:protein-disulfide isomerase [uncultured Psychromonas sp.]
MSSELFFIYDSHCPWSYAATPLVVALDEAFPEMEVHAWHCANYDGGSSVGFNAIKSVEKESDVPFSQEYIRFADSPKNSVISANLLAWISTKQSDKLLTVLQALQHAHFVEGNSLGKKIDFTELAEDLKLSIPNKVFKEELSKDALYVLSDINDLQDFMGTASFPALLLVHNDNAVLLNHAQYIGDPDSIVADVEKQLQG